jgi:hypothetical protein
MKRDCIHTAYSQMIMPVYCFIISWHTWVISKVLHTVCFLFKNDFILQNTFTGLQCNLHCALSQRSNVLGKSCIPVWTPSLLICLITQVTSLDTSSMLLKRFPRNGFFGTSQRLVDWAHQTLTCSQNWRNHSVGNASEALRKCLMRWRE